ncbi:uncharacterized protein LOC111709820 [Eurytemora carolleeae]|uniref:uncharacterized protein LOC111709820 n=1 Tax=Eurytemora carolleeae TaxID=1294199 RepID=UPI000C762AA1|nr:uncharacterized protein LOC111709820 [Eurytemora carolleeae]|eukprot:XP_023339504.1 uncharacterized protein LOC111709820 [Eurytemora affinis]
MMTFVAYKRKFSNNYLDYPEPTVKIKRNRVRKIPPPQFGGLLNAFSATMDEGEEINGLNVGSPMQMNGVNGGNQEEMNGMSSINGLQIMNTFSLSKEKSNGSSNEKTLALNKSISITKISRPSSQTNGNAQIHQNETDALIQIKTEKKVKEEPLEVAPFFCEN